MHQWGNLLLAVQGHTLHVEPDGISRMQDAVQGVVKRGGDSLQIVRALLGDRLNMPRPAAPLLAQIIELGRVPARERGLVLEQRYPNPAEPGPAEVGPAEPSPAQLSPALAKPGQPNTNQGEHAWVHGDAFVQCCAESLRQWLVAVPKGSTGVVTAACDRLADGGAMVLIGYEASAGSLPFPMASEPVVATLAADLVTDLEVCSGSIQARGNQPGIELRFASAAAQGGVSSYGTHGYVGG